MGLRLSDHSRQVDSEVFRAARTHRSYPDAPALAKRLLDIVIAGMALVFVAPVILLFAALIRLQDGHRAIFAQPRYGYGGKVFKCYKLRSMVPDAQKRLEYLLATDPAARQEWNETQKLKNDPRVTALGKFIRKTSIDELPQLINILRGDMSIVGPRPIVENEIIRYGDNFKQYCAVRPGLTGPWQVKGRSDTTYDDRVAMDVEYAENWTLMSDIGIMIKTIPAVLMSRGAR